MTDKTVPVTMPDWMWGRLATIAEHRHSTVGDVIAEALEGVVNGDDARLAQLSNALDNVRAGGLRLARGSLANASITYAKHQAQLAAEREKIRELHAAGLADGRIADELGLSRYQVQHRRHRMGLSPNSYHSKERKTA